MESACSMRLDSDDRDPARLECIRELLKAIDERGLRIWINKDEPLRCRAIRGTFTNTEVNSFRQAGPLLASFMSRRDPGRSHDEIGLAPLTFRQKWLWDQVQEDDVIADAFWVRYALNIHGVLDIDALKQSIKLVAKRHEALRTRITDIAGVPVQVIYADGSGELATEELRELAEDEVETDIERQMERIFDLPLDLDSQALFAAVLLRATRDRYVLNLAMHHLICDAESVTVFFRELWSAYRALTSSNPISLPMVTMQCGDYAVWQRARTFEKHREYWQTKLDGAEHIQWPVDSDLRNRHAYSSATYRMQFGQRFRDELYGLAQREKTIPAMVVLAIYVALVWRTCKQTSFVVPFNVNGRQRPEHSVMCGYFVHPLFMKFCLTGAESFLDVLQLAIREFNESRERSDYGRLQSVVPDLMKGAFLQWISTETLENVQLAEDGRQNNDRIKITYVSIPWRASLGSRLKFTDLILILHGTATGIRVWLSYRRDLFSPATVESILQDLRRIAESALLNPEARLSAL